MRTVVATVMILALLGTWETYDYVAGQQHVMAQARNAGPGECAAKTVDSVDTQLVAADDVSQAGVHRMSLSSPPRVVINVSSAWGGGEIEVPPDRISADFTVENVPRTVDDSGDALRFQITDLDAKVKSFNYPRDVITGENKFQIVKEKSYVRLNGSSGVVPIAGEAEALLTNRLFSSRNPAVVKASFEGEYDFATRVATLTKVEAKANSPSVLGVPKFELSAQFSSLNTRQSLLTEPGFGGRLTYNVLDSLAFEAEANFFPREERASEINGGRVTQAFVGLKAGPRFEMFNVFGTVKTGVQSFGRAVTGYHLENQRFFEEDVGRKTLFALNLGGGVELCPMSRVGVRFDVADNITFHPPRHSLGRGLERAPAFREHSFQFSSGLSYRF